ncbi:ABC transporter ATP-binding protein [Rhodococcus sp. D-1]|uniref:ABC transporter ATP-binding protein n=1 Tax=Rhodococcus sp. D-1 TaxID=1912238 RepID=UPI0009788D90|nr:ABC transporter ATP-binding protein [Rhodococcus sp. D-1]OMQ23879.1 nitrate ABC transporter ATP-binding protein [Rhodococcus sp. D-1]
MTAISITQTQGSAISLRDIVVNLGGHPILRDIDLEIQPGEFVCLLGPSGCGKSTLLSLMAGFLRPDEGDVEIAAQSVTAPRRSVGVVFQNSEALFPWLSVRSNVGYGPRLRGLKATPRREIEDRYLRLVGLSACADRYPRQLSGGMRQRVQIARVLANEPDVVLMDEPFGALDAQTRHVMQTELDRIWQATRPTIIFVTHDIDEAVLLADRVITMTAGPAARVKNDYTVDMARPRRESSREWAELRTVLRQDIETEVATALEQQGLS